MRLPQRRQKRSSADFCIDQVVAAEKNDQVVHRTMTPRTLQPSVRNQLLVTSDEWAAASNPAAS
jgi:hypothetical protein